MLTLLHPEAHEVTSAVIVPEFGEFKLVVNRKNNQIIFRRQSIDSCKHVFTAEFAEDRCAWSDGVKPTSYKKQYRRIKKLERMIDTHLKRIDKYENEIEQIKRGLK